ncbi:MAG: HAMP domain-containing sensor histidine kinase [Pedobacter sp.]|nr:HAMP domain-containing sensor histidine kinase [Pedobacter sp.]
MQKKSAITFDRIAFAKKSFLKVMNLVSIVSAILALLTACIGHDSHPYAWSLIALAGIFVISLALNYSGKIVISKYLIPWTTTVWITYMCLAFGSQLGIQNYLVIALVALTIFARSKAYRLFSILTIIGLTVCINIYQRFNPPIFPLPAAIDFLFVLNVVTPLGIITLICWNVLSDATNAQALIEKQKEELLESNHFKDKVLSIIGHDMRAPFNSAKGLLLLLEREALEKDEKEKIFTEIHADIDLSLQTLDNILNWASQGYYGTVMNAKINKKQLDISKLVAKTIKSFSHLAKQKNVELINAIEPSNLVWGDLEQVSFVLRNLTSNALKFSHTGQQVTFAISHDSSEKLVISISDEGQGMTQEMVSSLFKINSRFSKEGTAKEKGSGLGLIFCKEFAFNNNGDLWIESRPDQGTTAYFALQR